MRLNMVWPILRHVASWTLAGIGVVTVLTFAYQWVRPKNWHHVVIDTGGQTITNASMSMCGADYPLQNSPGRISGKFPDNCEHGAPILLETQTAQYWCPGGYVAVGLGPDIWRYKIENGKCRPI
jgi:hypothetical protein